MPGLNIYIYICVYIYISSKGLQRIVIYIYTYTEWDVLFGIPLCNRSLMENFMPVTIHSQID